MEKQAKENSIGPMSVVSRATNKEIRMFKDEFAQHDPNTHLMGDDAEVMDAIRTDELGDGLPVEERFFGKPAPVPLLTTADSAKFSPTQQ